MCIRDRSTSSPGSMSSVASGGPLNAGFDLGCWRYPQYSLLPRSCSKYGQRGEPSAPRERPSLAGHPLN
eukprot:12263161-Alexandrium_andersonii.AAC.1